MEPFLSVNPSSLGRLSHDELKQVASTLSERVERLERLVQIISRGKYMWESTFDAITLPVQIVNEDYEIERANVSCADVGGAEIVNFTGRLCYEAFAGRKTPCGGCPLQIALTTNATATSLLTDLIHHRHFQVAAYPYVHDASSGRRSVILSYRDVTEEQRLQQEMMQQEKMAAIGMLAGGVAHEINNPLGGIIAFTQLILRNVKENEQDLKEDLKEIESAAMRCKRIVADLLEFSRPSKERKRIVVNLKEVFEKVIPFVQSEMRTLNIDFQVNADPDLPLVAVQPDQLQQVFLNLLTNACHAMPKGGKLTVEMHPSPSHEEVVIFVKDTGEGIAPDNLSKIFDPFFTTKDPGKGTGLGLSITYRLIKEHGGTIDVESKLGEGTTFRIVLPRPVLP